MACHFYRHFNCSNNCATITKIWDSLSNQQERNLFVGNGSFATCSPHFPFLILSTSPFPGILSTKHPWQGLTYGMMIKSPSTAIGIGGTPIK